MAKYELDLPSDLMAQFERLEKSTDKMLAEMTNAGAKVVYKNIKNNVPSTWRDSKIMNCLKITKAYKTHSDDGINTKVAFYGYFINEKGVRTPAPLVANVTEYGRSNAPYPKKPFLRRSFNKQDIENAMMKIQEKYIPRG